MKKRLLLLGATGMAGHVAYYYLKGTNKYDIIDVVYRNKLTDDSLFLDVTDKNEVELLVREISPDIILNCVGVLIKGSTLKSDNAIFVNAYFPHLLERLAFETDSKLIHISTDCVFSGEKGNYSENDTRDADDVYGKSKGLGEVINDKDLTIRTSIIGPEIKTDGEGLFNWFMTQNGKINGYTEAFWGGVTTLELAKAIDKAIDDNVNGLVHLTNGCRISKYDLLQILKEVWMKNDVIVMPYKGKIIDKSLKRSERFDYNVPPYNDMMFELFEWMSNHDSLYKYVYK